MDDDIFADPSFLSGAARLVDLGGVFDGYNESLTPAAADERAKRSDWNAVGRDMIDAMAEFAREPDAASE